MFFGWRFRRLRLISAGEARRIAINIAQAARVVDCPRNLIQPSPLSHLVDGKRRHPSRKFPVREAPLASVKRGFLFPPIRNRALWRGGRVLPLPPDRASA